MHSDFTKLRSLLLRTEMEPLLRRTHAHFYEAFRRARLRKMGFSDTDLQGNPVSWHDALEAKRNQHMLELSKKEDEMRQSFVLKVGVCFCYVCIYREFCLLTCFYR
jgi:septin 6/8/11